MNTKLPNASVVYKGGKYLIQQDGKKGEDTYIYLLLESEAGKKWLINNKILETKPQECESPDYLFQTSQGKIVGLEITRLLIKTDKFNATARLNTIANKVVQYFRKEKNIPLSILIDIYDEREVSPDWEDILDAYYNPGFDKIEVTNHKIKDAIIEAISKKGIPEWGERKIDINLPPHLFTISYGRFFEPYTSTHVNNSGMCKEDPFEELQKVITDKNEKYNKYLEKCDACSLLVVSEGSGSGNFTCFTNKILKHKFDSKFENVYLLDLGSFTKNEIVKLRKF